MSRRGRGGGKNEGGGAHLEVVYEGPEVLTALLSKAGSPYGAREAWDTFKKAQASGANRSEVIPALFPDEPRFETPEDARRLYANLFGLWGRVKAGLGLEDEDAPIAVKTVEDPFAELPGRGSALHLSLDPDLVEAVWRHLANLPERELRRVRDRFMNAQPDLGAWLDTVPLPQAGGLAAAALVFETWAMFDQAFGDRLEVVEWKELRALEAEPRPLEAGQPAIAAYTAEQLDFVEDEESGFGPTERAQVERVVATAVAALEAAVHA